MYEQKRARRTGSRATPGTGFGPLDAAPWAPWGMMMDMVLLSLLLSAIAVPVAAAICFGFTAALRRLGYRSAGERVTGKDQRWLTRQHPDLNG